MLYRLTLLYLVLGGAHVFAQDGDFSNFNELELGDDDFSLDGSVDATFQATGSSDDFVDLADLPDADIAEFGIVDDPAAKIPKKYDIDLSNEGIELPDNQKTSQPQMIEEKTVGVPTGSSPSVVSSQPIPAQKASPNPLTSNASNLVEPAAAAVPSFPDNSANISVPPPIEATPVDPEPVQVSEPIIPEVVDATGSAKPSQALPPEPVVQPTTVFDEQPADVSVEAVVAMNDFSGAPYVAGSRRVMASGEAPERYLVEEGDTLYDVCDQLLDEPDYWPKLWALNPGIKNPHFIFPGMQLSFYPGDETTPPYLEVVTEDDIIPIDTGGIDEKDLVSVDVGQLVVEDDEIPAVEVIQAAGNDDIETIEHDTEFETFGEKYKADTVRIDIPAFFFESETDVLGEVVSGSYGEINAKAGEEIVVEKFSDLSLGSSFTIVRPSGLVYNENGDEVGYRYEYVAQVQMVSVTGDGDFLVASISRSRLGVRPKDQVIQYQSTRRAFNTANLIFNDSGTEASIVGFDYPNSIMGGEGNMVFVDGDFGAGTTLPVFQRVDTRIKRMLGKDLPAINSRIGIIKIIDRVGTASLGVIIKSTLDVRVGDRLSSG